MFKLLLTCRANQCRSPMAAALAEAILRDAQIDARVWSRGSRPGGYPAIRRAAAAMTARGLDITRHSSGQLTIADVDAADLILTMEPVLLGDIGALDRAALARSFTIPEMASLSALVGPREPSESIGHWIALCHGRRQERRPSSAEIDDPTGGWTQRRFNATADRLDDGLRQILHAMFPAEITLLGRNASSVD